MQRVRVLLRTFGMVTILGCRKSCCATLRTCGSPCVHGHRGPPPCPASPAGRGRLATRGRGATGRDNSRTPRQEISWVPS